MIITKVNIFFCKHIKIDKHKWYVKPCKALAAISCTLCASMNYWTTYFKLVLVNDVGSFLSEDCSSSNNNLFLPLNVLKNTETTVKPVCGSVAIEERE